MKSKLGINIYVFIIGMFIGLILINIVPISKNVKITPTPHNTNNIQYKDLKDNCFKFHIKKVQCNKYKNIKNIPYKP